MLFLREILLLAMVLCVCWETGDTTCQIECDQSQIGLALPTCFLRDDGTSTFCGISISSSDTAIRTLGSFDELTLLLDLQTKANRLDITSNIGKKVKISTFRYHREITSFTLHYENNQFNPVMNYLLPNLKYFHAHHVSFEFFPFFTFSNRFLTYLYIPEFDIPSATPRILTMGHVSGLTGLKVLHLSPIQYINTTDQSFSGLTALTYLYLEQFHIPNPIPTLSPLVSLKVLRIFSCKLPDTSYLTRTPSLYGLTRLVIENNLITHIPAGSFQRLNNLRFLYLGHNPIQNISLTLFKGLTSLNELYLQFTSLTSLSSRMFEYLPSLDYIYLSGTPLHCDCCLQWMSIVHHNFSLSLSLAYCASPSEHIGKLATDLSIYRDCTPDLSYQCFNRSNSCPSGSYCQDTLDTYTCVCEQEGYMFVRSLNRCVSTQEIGNCLS